MIDLAEAAINERVSALPYAIAWPDQPFEPVKGQIYVAVSMPFLNRRATSIGVPGSVVWTGVLMLVCAYPVVMGGAFARANAARVVLPRFDRGVTLVNGAARVVIEAADMTPSYSDLDRVRVPLRINWFCEEHLT